MIFSTEIDNVNTDRYKRLDSAYKCLRKGRYVEAAKCVEPFIAGGYDPYPLFIAGYAYVNSDRINMAIPIIRRLRSSFPDYLPGRELDLFIMIKSAERMEDATVACMNISATDLDDSHFRRIEKRIRRTSDFSVFQKKFRVSDCVRMRRYHPHSRFAVTRIPRNEKKKIRKKGKLIPVVIILSVITGLGSVSIWFFLKNMPHMTEFATGKKVEIDMLVLPDDRYPLTGKVTKDERYKYDTEEGLRRDFEIARKLAKEGKHNESLLLLNRILMSNAQPGVIDRAEFLRDYVIHIENRRADKIAFSRIRKEPELYRGVMIEFRGTVVRKNTGDRGSSFSLYTGEESGDQIEIFHRTKFETGIGSKIHGEGVFMQLIGKKRQLYIESHVIENE